jgi:hypothetical protein
LTAFTENFSSIPLIAPPPLGKEIDGMSALTILAAILLMLHPL